MSYDTYNLYDGMTSEEKDHLYDYNSDILSNKVRLREVRNDGQDAQFNQNKSISDSTNKQPFKRQLTSSSYLGDINVGEEEDDQFILVGRYNKRKQRRIDEFNENKNNEEDISFIDQSNTSKSAVNVNNRRIFLNSKKKTSNENNENYCNRQSHRTHHSHVQEDKNKNGKSDVTMDDVNIKRRENTADLYDGLNSNDKNKSNGMNSLNMPISQHALLYAVGNHLPPIKINCQPKIMQNQQGTEIVTDLFKFIEKNFHQLNKNYKYPLGFDYWYIDKNGDLICYTKHTELFVYLCDPQNYPTSLANINISQSKPRHLPSQHSIVLKYIPNYITLDEIKTEVETYIKSMFNMEDMRGSMNEKSRHVRLELTSLEEHQTILNNGGITINGHLIEAQEFLSPPRILICSKCNDPGHIRRNCKFQYDACRRCGKDRLIGNHNDCYICCHRCHQNHLSTDYKCPFLVDYRRSLLIKLKDQPQILPPNIQIFIPTECRDRNTQNNRMICNPSDQLHKNSSKRCNALPFKLSSYNWPSLPKQSDGDITIFQKNEQPIWKEINLKQIEINKFQDDLNSKIQKLQDKYEDNMKKNEFHFINYLSTS